MRLVAIESSGEPREPVADLPEVAKGVLSATAQMYERAGFADPWIGYLAIVDEQCIGTCGFKGAPDSTEEGAAVEIAYFTFPENEGRGHATRMAQALCELAKRTNESVRILAQTLPERNASHRILEKLGFQKRSTVLHPEDGEVAEWELSNP